MTTTAAAAELAQTLALFLAAGMAFWAGFRSWQARQTADRHEQLWQKQDKLNKAVAAVVNPQDPAHQLTIDRDDAEKAAALVQRIAGDREQWMHELHDLAALLTPGDTGAPGQPYATVRRRQDGQPW